MYDNILNRSLRFIGNVSERARHIIEQVCYTKISLKYLILLFLVIKKKSE